MAGNIFCKIWFRRSRNKDSKDWITFVQFFVFYFLKALANVDPHSLRDAEEIPKTGKKRLRKQGKPSGTYACRYRSKSYNFSLLKAKAPRNLWLEKCTGLDRQSSFWQDTIERRTGLVETFSNKVTCAWQNRQETDFKRFSCRRSSATVVRAANFCHDSCESGSVGSSLPLPSVCARLAQTVSFSHRFCSWSL